MNTILKLIYTTFQDNEFYGLAYLLNSLVFYNPDFQLVLNPFV